VFVGEKKRRAPRDWPEEFLTWNQDSMEWVGDLDLPAKRRTAKEAKDTVHSILRDELGLTMTLDKLYRFEKLVLPRLDAERLHQRREGSAVRGCSRCEGRSSTRLRVVGIG